MGLFGDLFGKKATLAALKAEQEEAAIAARIQQEVDKAVEGHIALLKSLREDRLKTLANYSHFVESDESIRLGSDTGIYLTVNHSGSGADLVRNYAICNSDTGDTLFSTTNAEALLDWYNACASLLTTIED